MSAKKREAAESNAAVADKPSTAGNSRTLIGGILFLAAFVGVGYLVWNQVRGHVMSGAQYQIDLSQITITEPPAWIHSDIKAEVLRDVARKQSLSLLDPDLTVRLASAFAAHPWVAHVERVSKRFPAGLDVDLSFRRPVAMVEVADGTGALPVDGLGVVLPTHDFAPADAEAYPRIGEIHTTPAGEVGTAWGDERVAGAAQIAAALGDEWRPLGIYRIVPAGQKNGRTGAEPIFNLLTRSGGQIAWGRAPATNMPGEVAAIDKINQLKRYAAQNNGSLEMPDGSQLEIRDDGALFARPRPEVRPLPKQGE